MVRSLIHAGTEILRDAYDRTQSADELVSQAERKIMDIARAGMVGETKTLNQAILEALSRIDSRAGKDHTSRSAACRRDTSISIRLLAGLQNSELAIIAARPSDREDRVRAECCPQRHQSITARTHPVVLFVSLEMSRDRTGRAVAVLPVAGGQPQGAQGVT